MYLVSQKEIKDLIDNGNLDNSNFIIIKGPKNYGKTYLTKYIANHYSMNYVLLDNKVDTIRSLVEVSNMNNNCLYHFKDFEKSSPAAKAALLKICEETPKEIKIVITTSAHNLLDTLISRAYNINIQPYLREEMQEYINTLNMNKDVLNKLYDSYNMMVTPTLLLNYKNFNNLDEILEKVDETIDALSQNKDLEHISQISNKFYKCDINYVKNFLNILQYAILIDKKIDSKFNLKYVSIISKNLFILEKLTITNFKQFIHNLLMEMIE